MLEEKAIGKINSDDADRDESMELDVRDALNLIPKVGGVSKSVRRENVKGTQEIVNQLPAGTNKTIGEFEDRGNERLYYFNFNSNDNHGIYVYEFENNSVNTVLLTPGAGVIEWTVDTVISGAGLVDNQLLWCEKDSSPKKISIQEGINTFGNGEKKSWNYLIPKLEADYNGVTFKITGDYVVGGIIVETVATGGSDRQVLIDDIESFFIAHTGYDVEVCDDRITVTARSFGIVNDLNTDGSSSDVSRMEPLNHYQPDFIGRYIELINEPSQCPPVTIFESDASTKDNYIGSRTFQFATRKIYKDNTKSTISPLSKILLGQQCDELNNNSNNNCILVTFKDSIFDQEELSILKNVEILFREGNIGAYQSAEVLDSQEFYEGVYRFYNDGSYSVVATTDSGKLFDSIHLK